MPRDSQGAASLPSGTLVSAGDTVQPSQHNPAMLDIQSMLTGSLSRDGLGGMRAALPMGGYPINNIGNPSAPQDAVTLSYLGSATSPITATVSSGSISPISGVSGIGSLPSASFTNNGAGGSVFGVTSSITNGGNNTSSWHYAGITQSVAIWYLYGNGTTSYTSDIRTKQNIKPARAGYLDEWSRVRFVKFDRRSKDDINLAASPVEDAWDGGAEPAEIGVLSQDVASIWPSLAVSALHNLDGTTGHGHKVLQVKDGILYGPILGRVVQELIDYARSLEARIEALEA